MTPNYKTLKPATMRALYDDTKAMVHLYLDDHSAIAHVVLWSMNTAGIDHVGYRAYTWVTWDDKQWRRCGGEADGLPITFKDMAKELAAHGVRDICFAGSVALTQSGQVCQVCHRENNRTK